MEDPNGVLNCDFEGGLDPTAVTGPTHTGLTSNAPSHPAPSSPNPTTIPSQQDQNVNPSGRKIFRQTVCRHWLRSLYMKGEDCGFLHQNDKSLMRCAENLNPLYLAYTGVTDLD